MKKITLLAAMTVISICSQAQPFLGLYGFDSVKTTSGITDPSPVPTAIGVTFGSFSSVGNSANSGAASRFDFNHWAIGSITGDSLYSQMTGIVADTQYYEVVVGPASGYTINLDSIKFSFLRSLTGVRNYSVRSSIDGFVSNLSAIYGSPNVTDTVESGNIFFLRKDIMLPQLRNEIVLGGMSFSNLSSPVSFRFYGWNSEGNVGTFSLDNVRIIGSAAMATVVKENSKQELTLFPNPSSTGIFTVDFGNTINQTTVTVYDVVGKIILTKEINSINKQSIDISNQANGIYFVNIKNDKSIVTRKIIINK